MLQDTPRKDIDSKFDKLKASFKAGTLRSIQSRINLLRRMDEMLTAEESFLAEAVYKDLGRSPNDTFTQEIAVAKAAISYAIANMHEFFEPEQDKTKLSIYYFEKVETRRQPHGVVLIVAPWNYRKLMVTQLCSWCWFH
jgi:aldehyde dehydrogenase (NAD+)